MGPKSDIPVCPIKVFAEKVGFQDSTKCLPKVTGEMLERY
jgi:hypothetical protein